MTDDSESVALRPTVTDGKPQEDDYEVILARSADRQDLEAARRAALVVGLPTSTDSRRRPMTADPPINFKDCQLRFKIAWTRIRAGLTEEDIAVASRHAEKLAEAQPSNADGRQNPRTPKSGE